MSFNIAVSDEPCNMACRHEMLTSFAEAVV